MSSPVASRKRTINAFFTPSQPAKRARTSPPASEVQSTKTFSTPPLNQRNDEEKEAQQSSDTPSKPEQPATRHPNYPRPIGTLPPELLTKLHLAPSSPGKILNSNPDLDCLYYTPFLPPSLQTPLFRFFRTELPFYRVQYAIKRGNVETQINTPRYTTVYGVDETSCFSVPPDSPSDHPQQLFDATTRRPVPASAYKCRPRPIPSCLDALRYITEATTGHTFNFCLVNYYATGSDSISYHSDDERFLGDNPAIASFSLGAPRDFLLRHKEAKSRGMSKEEGDLKLRLGSGDMILMRGSTQSKWLHSLPKRAGGKAGEQGRINITLRRAMGKGGTENYYRYNVGEGGVFRWDGGRGEMVLWEGEGEGG